MQPNGLQAPIGWNGAIPLGGESDISHHYAALPAGELEKMMLGNVNPAKIYQAIPSDSPLYPVVESTEKGGTLVWDPASSQFTVSDGGLAQVREKSLLRLTKTLDKPIKFACAWGWFVVLTSYKYRDPDLAAAMSRFGWKVVSFSNSNDWSTCLRVFVELATPLLTGNLLNSKFRFDTVSFSEALGPYRSSVPAPTASSITNTAVSPAASAVVASAAAGAGAATQGRAVNKPGKMPICRRFNDGECNGIGCRYQHVCSGCGVMGHTQPFCPTNPSQSSHQGFPQGASYYGGMQGPGGYPNQQRYFNGYNSYNNSGYGQQQTYSPAMAQPQQATYAPPSQLANAPAASAGPKPRGYGPNQQAKAPQA